MERIRFLIFLLIAVFTGCASLSVRPAQREITKESDVVIRYPWLSRAIVAAAVVMIGTNEK